MIAIIGGGISGLALGHQLARTNTEFLLLEASERPGGVIRSGRVEGHVLEWGPQRARLTEGFRELVAELDLGSELITSPPGLPLYVYRSGRLRRVPFSPSEFFRSDIIGWPAKLRLALEPFTAAPRDDESVAALFTRKIGREAYENLVGPLYGGLYASDPEDMVVGLSLRHVLREFGLSRSFLLALLRRGGRISPPDACSFREGMQMLPDALARRHADRIRYLAPVREVRMARGRLTVVTENEEIEASHVVLTSPAPATAEQLAGIAPDAANRLRRLRYNPLAVVHLLADTGLHGLGYQVSFAEPLVTRGVTWNDSLFGRKGVYTVYLGGARHPEVRQQAEEELGRLAVEEFRLATGYDARPLSVEQELMPAWDRSWAALSGLELPTGLHICANWESRPGIPGRLLQAKRLAAKLAAAAGR
jgi:oxygen-dependent protoporphyrinogen oxidase